MTSKPLPASLALFAVALLAAGGYALNATASDDSRSHACGALISAEADGQKVSPCGALAPSRSDTEPVAANANEDCCAARDECDRDNKVDCEKKAECDKKVECDKAVRDTVAISVDAEEKKADKDEDKDRAITSPKLISGMFHSDYCGACKAMEPLIKEAAEKLTDKPVLFVTLDLTDDKTKKQAELLAGALGLDKVWSENHTRTGFMKLVNAETGEDLETITVRHETEDIVETATTALEATEAEVEAAAEDVEDKPTG